MATAETVTRPPGWRVDRVPESKKLESGSASFTFEATPGDGAVTYRLEMVVKNNIIPPEHYVGYKEAIDTLRGLADEWVVCSVADSDIGKTKQASAKTGTDEVHHD